MSTNNPKQGKRNPKPKPTANEPNDAEGVQKMVQDSDEKVDDMDDESAIELPDSLSEDEDAKKAKVNYSGSITRDELVRYFEAIALGLRQGTIKFAQESNIMALHPGDTVEFQLKASRKAYLEKVVFELSWRSRHAPALHILSD